MQRQVRNTLLKAVLTLGFLIAVTLLFIEFNKPIQWQTVQRDQYSFLIPEDWVATDGGYSGTVERQKQKNDQFGFCDRNTYTAKIDIIGPYDGAVFNWRKANGGTENISTKDDAYDYIALKNGEVILERDLGDGAVLVVGDGRYASAPCIDYQYSGFVVDGDHSLWIRLTLDEERNDIIFPLYESIARIEP